MFAASDRPTIIYSSNKKLLYSNLNENEVRGVHAATWQGRNRACSPTPAFRLPVPNTQAFVCWFFSLTSTNF